MMLHLGSTKSLKKFPDPGCVLLGGKAPHQNKLEIFLSKMFWHFWTIFFFKSVQIKDAKCAESKEKSNLRFFYFYFSSYGHFCDVIIPIFDNNSKNINLRIFKLFFPYYTAHSPSSLETGSKLRGGGLYIGSWEITG